MPPLRDLAAIEERARTALQLPLELADVEFKQDGSFEDLKYKICKAAMGMANLRDGGLIVIGVSQDSQRRFVVDGMAAHTILTYVQEIVLQFVTAYASPPVELRVVSQFMHDGKSFVLIAVSPFDRTPVVCHNTTPTGLKKPDQMNAGDFFIRTSNPAGTSKAVRADMIQDLLQIAAGRRAAEIIRSLNEGGVRFDQVSTTSRFDGEVEDIADRL